MDHSAHPQAVVPIRVMMVEDHPIYRAGLRMVLSAQPDMEVVAEAGTVEEAVAAHEAHGPDIILMDLRLHDSDATSAVRTILARESSVRIIALTTADSDGEIRRLLSLGVAGYVLKSMPSNELFDVIRSVHAGNHCIPPDVAARLALHFGESLLTARELEVVSLLRDGRRNKHIARDLGIAEATVAFHIKNVVSKLNADDRTQAVAIAIRRGLLAH